VERLAPFLEHLTYLGYEPQTDDAVVHARHEQRWNVLLREYRGGVLLTAFLSSNDYAKQHERAFLGFINHLNRQATVARFYSDDDRDLVMEAFWAGPYDRERFGAFLELWDEDTRAHLLERDDVRVFFG